MPFRIVRQDITKLKVDAIVNASNPQLQSGGGVSGAIFKAAGARKLQKVCDKLAPITVGQAVITPGFDLPARHIIHTVGPVYRVGEERQLRMAYKNSLKIAVANKCESVAFPLISSGTYAYPKEKALQIGLSTIQDFLETEDLDVTLVIFDQASFVISQEVFGAVEDYIREHYEGADQSFFEHDSLTYSSNLLSERSILKQATRVYQERSEPLDHIMGQLDEPFSQVLFRLIDRKGLTDVEVYRRANLDRKLFSKIRTQKGYMPSKRTAISLALALKLTLEETDYFLERAGYALSTAIKFDVIVSYYITEQQYDLIQINATLYAYDQPQLGC